MWDSFCTIGQAPSRARGTGRSKGPNTSAECRQKGEAAIQPANDTDTPESLPTTSLLQLLLVSRTWHGKLIPALTVSMEETS
jgi:hypothetical protein